MLLPITAKTYVLTYFFQSRYALVIKAASNCMKNPKINIVMYKNSSSLAKNNVGFVEFLEAIEPYNNFQVKIFVTCFHINNNYTIIILWRRCNIKPTHAIIQ